MYKPPGWPEIVSHLCRRGGDRLLIEDTADALLEALRKEGIHQDAKWVDDIFGLHTQEAGTLVFIPDKE